MPLKFKRSAVTCDTTIHGSSKRLADGDIGRSLFWLRSDLRIADNPALVAASRFAGKHGVMSLYVLSPADYKRHDLAAVKVDFLLRNLRVLRESMMNTLGIPLQVVVVENFQDIPRVILEACKQNNVDAVFWNQEYEHDECQRDQDVEKVLGQNGILVQAFDEQCIVSVGKVLTNERRTPYTVFTPFKRNWVRRLYETPIVLLPEPPRQKKELFGGLRLREIPDALPGFEIVDKELAERTRKEWPAGEKEASERLQRFLACWAASYKGKRDFPAADGTSRLSAYLACGSISARTCLFRAQAANNGALDSGNTGLVAWINELCWRDFYRHVLFHFPYISRGMPFNKESSSIAWRDRPKEFERWCNGTTGVPIVDAAMRSLNATGWLHNRLRMVVAMYLVKDLLINWQLGERYFMQHLIDGDFASNNGGWQWSASTGTDSQPYFRVFNPLKQSENFDADGAFIREWVSELREVKGIAIHDPHQRIKNVAEKKALNYPLPIVDHNFARKRALAAFEAIKRPKQPREI